MLDRQFDSTYSGSQSLDHEKFLDAKESRLYDVTDDTCDKHNAIQDPNGMEVTLKIKGIRKG